MKSADKMANSKYEYVKEFEREDPLFRNTWIVVRIDGRGFHKYVSSHSPLLYFIFSRISTRFSYFDSLLVRFNLPGHKQRQELTRNPSFRFSAKYDFAKPNDRRALDLMNAAAEAVMKEMSDIVLAYGISDEYSFVFHKDTPLFGRRSSKLMTTVVSTFTAYYVSLWSHYFPDKILTSPMPTFDGRCVEHPSVGNLRDYMCWRQTDCTSQTPLSHMPC